MRPSGFEVAGPAARMVLGVADVCRMGATEGFSENTKKLDTNNLYS